MKRLIFSTALSALALTLPAAAEAQQLPGAVVAIIDRDRIASTCTPCVAAAAQIQAQGRAYQAREQALLTPLQAEGQAIQAAVQAAAGNATPALQTRIQAFRTSSEAAERELGLAQNTLRRNQQHLVNQILERMNPLIGQVTRERGASVALDVQSTLAHNPALNVTDAVLALMNQNATPFGVIAPPQTQPPAQQPAQQPPRPRPRPQGR